MSTSKEGFVVKMTLGGSLLTGNASTPACSESLTAKRSFQAVQGNHLGVFGSLACRKAWYSASLASIVGNLTLVNLEIVQRYLAVHLVDLGSCREPEHSVFGRFIGRARSPQALHRRAPHRLSKSPLVVGTWRSSRLHERLCEAMLRRRPLARVAAPEDAWDLGCSGNGRRRGGVRQRLLRLRMIGRDDAFALSKERKQTCKQERQNKRTMDVYSA